MRIFRYSHWLLCNLCVKFADQYFTDTHYVGGHCARSILKNAVPLHLFSGWYLGSLRTKFQGDSLSLHTLLIGSKEAPSCINEVGFVFFQSFLNNSHLCMTTCQVMSKLWKLKMSTANRNTEASCRVSNSNQCQYNSAEGQFSFQILFFFNLKSGLTTPRLDLIVTDRVRAAKIATRLYPFWWDSFAILRWISLLLVMTTRLLLNFCLWILLLFISLHSHSSFKRRQRTKISMCNRDVYATTMFF